MTNMHQNIIFVTFSIFLCFSQTPGPVHRSLACGFQPLCVIVPTGEISVFVILRSVSSLIPSGCLSP